MKSRLWKRNSVIVVVAVFVAAGPIESAAQRLSADILRRGAPDNYSFVIVEV